MKDYFIDHATTTIICTKKFYEKASRFGTPECDECQKLLTAFPTYSITVRAIKTNENKRTANKNLTYANMVRYIASQPNAAENLVEFAKIRNLSDQKGNGYSAVKNWFLEMFPAYLIPSVSKQEKENAERFISLETAREILDKFSSCETLDEMRDVINTHMWSDKGKVVQLDSASNDVA